MISDSTRLAKFDAVTPFENALGVEIHKAKNVLKCVYDFAVSGGAIGSIALLDDRGNPAILPAGAIITRSFLDVLTPATSGGAATVALHAEAAGDVLAATAVASVTGRVAGKADGTVANMSKTTVARQVNVDIATAALTAGKFSAFIEYVLN